MEEWTFTAKTALRRGFGLSGLIETAANYGTMWQQHQSVRRNQWIALATIRLHELRLTQPVIGEKITSNHLHAKKSGEMAGRKMP
ncbi:hypothetical protein [Roseibium sediminis]|uniref:hypothetical protein n=1 Tax=Roseibium sediminis TaxID=1775174 RepID=UPI00123D4CD4|nr:hypothetical protein [Roseibium sediminis]